MKPSPAIARIRAARRTLNALRSMAMAARAGTLGACAGAVAGAAASLAGWLSPQRASALGLAAGAAGLAFGLALSARGRYRDEQAALWLDRGLGDEGLFPAALACHERRRIGAAGPRDGELMARADEASPATAGFRVPRRYLARPLALFAASLLLCPAVLAIPYRPASAAAGAAGPGQPAAPIRERDEASTEELLAEAADSPSPEDLARSLFPDQPELADLLADALRDGRLADAEKILERAELARTDLRKEQGQGVGAPGARTLHERLQDAVREQNSGSGGSDETRSERGEEGGSGDRKSEQTGELDAAPMEAPDGPGDRPPGDGASGDGAPGGGGGSGSGQGQDDGTGGGSGAESPGGLADPRTGDKAKGGASGSGSGASKDWGPIDPAATGGDLGIKPLDGGAYFELILPEDGSGMSDLQRVIASSRSAEEAIARLSLPAEYEDAIRAYFTLLNRDAAAEAGP